MDRISIEEAAYAMHQNMKHPWGHVGLALSQMEWFQIHSPYYFTGLCPARQTNVPQIFSIGKVNVQTIEGRFKIVVVLINIKPDHEHIS